MQIEQLLTELKSGEHETYPVATDADIELTEQAIGLSLPKSFKTFVRDFSNGAYLYSVQEVSAVGEGNEQIHPIQDFRMELTDGTTDAKIAFYEGGETPFDGLVPFSLDGNGNMWCFITSAPSQDGEYPVAYLDTMNPRLFGKLEGFTHWLEVLVREEEEVIRTLYDEDVIYDELELG